MALAWTLTLPAPASPVAPSAPDPGPWAHLGPGAARALGERIWHNEGLGREAYLVWWNEGEEFASLGIGHFIWYPPGHHGRFRESFPPLLAFLAAHEVTLPGWLERARHEGCPWTSRTELLAARGSTRFRELHDLLARTIELQAQFIAAGLEPAYRRVLAHARSGERSAIAARIRDLAGSDRGLYALVDYLNFKGDGTRPRERYAGEGWGLLQVLREMGTPALRDVSPAPVAFARAARVVLERRVANAPPERGEERWLPGWRRRLLTYYPDPPTR